MTSTILAIGMPGPFEMVVVLIIAVLLFGRRLPEIARGMGKSLSEFKKGIKEAKDDVEQVTDIDDIHDEIQDTSNAVDNVDDIDVNENLNND